MSLHAIPGTPVLQSSLHGSDKPLSLVLRDFSISQRDRLVPLQRALDVSWSRADDRSVRIQEKTWNPQQLGLELDSYDRSAGQCRLRRALTKVRGRARRQRQPQDDYGPHVKAPRFLFSASSPHYPFEDPLSADRPDNGNSGVPHPP